MDTTWIAQPDTLKWLIAIAFIPFIDFMRRLVITGIIVFLIITGAAYLYVMSNSRATLKLQSLLSKVFLFSSFDLFRPVVYVLGGLLRWLATGWRLALYLIVAAVAVIWSLSLITRLGDLVHDNNTIPPLASVNESYLVYLSGKSLLYIAWMRFHWQYVLIFLALSALVWTIWKARSSVVIEEFTDYTGDSGKADKEDAKDRAAADRRGLSTLMVSEFSRIVKLYDSVNEKSTVTPPPRRDRPAPLVVKVDDIGDFADCFSGANATIAAAGVSIPIGAVMKLFSRLVKGPRIAGSIHRENDRLIITARKIGCGRTCFWRVESAGAGGSTPDRSIDDMMKELAYKIFMDQSPVKAVRWEATRSFVEGLWHYRFCLRSSQDCIRNLQQAETRFREAITYDEEFDDAYHNLGVVYRELGYELEKASGSVAAVHNRYFHAAEKEFGKAIEKNPKNFDAYYGLAFMQYLFQRHEEAVQLCDRITDNKEEPISPILLAKAYNLKGLSQRHLCRHNENRLSENLGFEENRNALVEYACGKCQADDCAGGIYKPSWPHCDGRNQDALVQGLDRSIKTREAAVAYSRMALMSATFSGRCLQMAEEVACVCLYNLGMAYYYRAFLRGADRPGRTYDFEIARSAFLEAARIAPSDSTLYNMLGKISYWQERYDKAVLEYGQAIQIEPRNYRYWANLAIVYSKRLKAGDSERVEEICDRIAYGPDEVPGLILEKTVLACKTLSKSKSPAKANDKWYPRCLRISFMARMKLLEDLKKHVDSGLPGLPMLWDELKKYDCNRQAWEYAQVAIAIACLHGKSGIRISIKTWLQHVGECLKNETVCYEIDQISSLLYHVTGSDNTTASTKPCRSSDMTEDDFFASIAMIYWYSALGVRDKAMEFAKNACLSLSEDNKNGEVEALFVSTAIQCCLKHGDHAEDKMWPFAEINTMIENTELDWECARVFKDLGDACLKAENAQAAGKHYEAAIVKLRCRYPDMIRQWKLYEALAKSRVAGIKAGKAVLEVQKALELNPGNARSVKELGDAYYLRKEYPHALKAYKQTQLLDPACPDVCLGIGLCKYHLLSKATAPENRKNLEDIAENLEQALALYEYRKGEGEVPTHYWLGRINCELGNYPESLSHFRVAEATVCPPGEPGSPGPKFEPIVASYYLARAFLSNGMYDEGIRKLQDVARDLETSQQGKDDQDIGALYMDNIPRCEIVARAGIDLVRYFASLDDRAEMEQYRRKTKEFLDQIENYTALKRLREYTDLAGITL